MADIDSDHTASCSLNLFVLDEGFHVRDVLDLVRDDSDLVHDLHHAPGVVSSWILSFLGVKDHTLNVDPVLEGVLNDPVVVVLLVHQLFRKHEDDDGSLVLLGEVEGVEDLVNLDVPWDDLHLRG